jgi:hypothetical protein
MADIPITVSGEKKELTVKTNGKLSHQEEIDLPNQALKVTLTGVTGAEKCTDIVLPAGGSWTLTIDKLPG